MTDQAETGNLISITKLSDTKKNTIDLFLANVALLHNSSKYRLLTTFFFPSQGMEGRTQCFMPY